MLSTLNQENWTQYQGTELEAIRENLADSHIKPLRMGNQSAHSPESRQNNPITKPPPVASYHAVTTDRYSGAYGIGAPVRLFVAAGFNTPDLVPAFTRHPPRSALSLAMQGNPSCRMKTYWGIQLLMPLPYQNV